jgi:ABC-type Fe3+-siderophore transport system permease subunit
MTNTSQRQLLLLTLLTSGLMLNISTSGSDFDIAQLLLDQDFFPLLEFRLARAALAASCGAALALAGLATQILFRNPLASPSVIGVESASLFGTVLGRAYLQNHPEASVVVMVSSIIFAILMTVVQMTVMSIFQSITLILLIGISVSAFMGACTALILSIAMESPKGLSLYHYAQGSFSAATWNDVLIMVSSVSVSFYMMQKKSLDCDRMALGSSIAKSLGVHISSLQRLLLLITASLVGLSYCVGGVLPFLALMAPHIARFRNNQSTRPLIVQCGLIGIAISLWGDFASKALLAPAELNAGLITTILGSLYFGVVAWRGRHFFQEIS